ncbi:hypothetical protein NSU_1983 [Novosphingobium pentaromativorans US6-1]|uniref:Uncharacterized protein n=1 Tax=Novosphingobium pentaromativorans US6-1 TaxID=1088721 RepID=G6ECB2_9SPHN|nr:hypothetical protein NSU_1983 [Novosphingobium pentaromativorans US6-1]
MPRCKAFRPGPAHPALMEPYTPALRSAFHPRQTTPTARRTASRR